MSEHMKKLPTKEVRIKISKNNEKLFLVPKDKVDGIIKILSEYEAEESVPWRDSFSKEIKETSEAAMMLRGCRAKEDMTQKELAEKLGTSQPNIAALENGTRPIGKGMARKLAKTFKTDYRIFL